MSKFRTARDAAEAYIAKGWQVVPLAPKTKAPEGESVWRTLEFKPDDFEEFDNIGIKSMGGLIDIDLDCSEVVSCAPAFLPPTGAIYGRKSKPRSHWLYRGSLSKPIAYKDFTVDGHVNTLLELRVDHQSMAPPSLHPDVDERVEWDTFGTESTVEDISTLLRAARLAATCALTARYYNPPSNRHDWGLALAAYFRELSITEEEAKKIFTEAAKIAHDPKVADRLSCIRTTYNRPDDEPLKGATAIKELMANGAGFLKSLNKLWGASSSVFILDEKGERILANNQENIRRALARLEVTMSFDKFSHRMMYTNGNQTPSFYDDHASDHVYCEIDSRFHFRPTRDWFDTVVHNMAYHNPFHPVVDWLFKLKWDGKERIDKWLIDYGKADDNPYVRAVSGMFLIAAVRRVRKPGCKFDEMIVLESPQGFEKSSALAALCPNPDWFNDDMPLDVDSKVLIEKTSGKWIIEAAELSGLSKAKVEHLKANLSRQVDGPVRMAYAREPIERQRQFVIVGTTNRHSYLKDATGGRRFWPVRVDRFDIRGIIQAREQLWAEAAAREAGGESIRLDRSLWDLAGLQQERRRVEHPWEDTLSAKFPPDVKHRVTREELWDVIGIPVAQRDERQAEQLAVVMQQLGFRRISVKKDGKISKGWGRDPEQGSFIE